MVQRICDRSGLTIEHRDDIPRDQHRVFLTEYGALNPQVRSGESSRDSWGRFDPVDHATLYTSDTEVGAVLESLQQLAQKDEAFAAMDAAIDGVVDEIREFYLEEKRQAFGFVFAGYRLPRQLARLRFAGDEVTGEYYVVVDETDSGLHALTKAMGSRAPLTTSDVYSEKRQTTTRLADAIAGTVLDDGSLPLGIRYYSRFGRNHMCTATWIPDFQFDGGGQTAVSRAFSRRFHHRRHNVHRAVSKQCEDGPRSTEPRSDVLEPRAASGSASADA